MAQQVVLSENGRLIDTSGQPVDITVDDVTIDEVTITKLGMGVTPVGVRSAYTQTYSTAARTVASATAAALTDSTTGSGATTTLAAGVGVYDLVLPAPANLSTLGTGGVDVVTAMVPGHKFKILSWEFLTGVAGTGAGATLAFNLEIGAVDVGTTPSTCTVNLAGTSDIGERTAATAVAGANTGAAADTLSLEVAAGGTAFTAGSGFFVVKIQNMDTADAFAGLVTQHAAVVADALADRKVINALIDDSQAFGLAT